MDMEKRADELAEEFRKTGKIPDSSQDIEKLPEPPLTEPPQPHMPKFQYDSTKTMDENATDLVELEGSQKALNDDTFIDKISETKKDQINQSANLNKDIHVAKKTAEKIEATTKVDSAFYDEYPIYDHAIYIPDDAAANYTEATEEEFEAYKKKQEEEEKNSIH